MPMMAFIGVRISWLMLARKSDLALVAASAASLATARSAACTWVWSSSFSVSSLLIRILVLSATVGSKSVQQRLLALRHRSRRRQFDDGQHDVLIDHGDEEDARRASPSQHLRRPGEACRRWKTI